jgi:hypothetical protein
MPSDYHLLIAKLDEFIRKFYKDQLIRGALYSVGLVVAVFLAVALLEHLGRFGTTARTLLFWGTVVAMLAVLARFVVVPLVKLFRLGPVIGHDQAARIIGTHFTEVQDKLLNTLQLHQMAGEEPGRAALIEAAIAQRSRELAPVPFVNAIDLRRNRRYLRYALPPLGVLLVLLFAAPSLITGPTQRLVRHAEEFVPEAPFRFVLETPSLEVREQQDLEVVVRLDGEVVPQQVDLELDGARIPLVKQDARRFAHRFRNVREAQAFRFHAQGFNSEWHTLVTVPHPLLLDLAIHLEYPGYLDRPAETLRNTGDLVVPQGTKATWTVGARSSDRLDFTFGDSTTTLMPEARDPRGAVFRTDRRLMRGATYRMRPALADRVGDEPLEYRIDVVPDLHPTIAVEERTDSNALKRLYFHGAIGDDHGLRRLVFHHRFTQGGDTLPAALRSGAQEVRIDQRANRQDFYHTWDLYGLPIGPGDRLEYWFEVWDNDGVNGSKSTRSRTGVFAAPTLKELAQQQERTSESLRSDLKDHIKEAQDLQRELDKLRRDLLEKKEMGWQEKQKLENVLDRQRELEQRIERSTEQLRQSQQQQREFRQLDERLLEKQEQLQKLFENILNEEMKELYRQMNEMLDKLDKNMLEEQLKEMKLGQEDIEKELDRALELFKRMEVEQQAEDIAQQLKDLADKQEELAERTAAGKEDKDKLMQEQKALEQEFKDLREQLDKLQEKNEALEKPFDLPNTDQLEQEIQKDQQRGQEQLQKNQPQKAAGSQQKAAENMQQMAHQLESAMQGGQQEQQEEDMDALRQLLENILHLSFEQEKVMEQVKTTNVRDPRFVDHGRTQRRLRDDAKVVEDSLFALSKRVPQIQSIVNREMNAVNGNMDDALTHLGEARANERHRPMAADKQQHAMTSLNNLALLLDEALQQMMQQQAQMSGSGSCNKPGKPGQGQGGGMAKMKAQQQALQKQLEEMRKAMEQGRKPGEKPGDKNPGGMGMPGMGQQLAQMAAQQAAIRKELQRLAQELNKDGSGAGNGLNKLAEEMEKQERDIVNRNITPETLRRQQDIMTRLLEHEKAERERELDQKRTSNEGRDQPPPDPARYFGDQRRKAREAELLRTVPPGLKPYYRDRVNSYFGTFDRP